MVSSPIPGPTRPTPCLLWCGGGNYPPAGPHFTAAAKCSAPPLHNSINTLQQLYKQHNHNHNNKHFVPFSTHTLLALAASSSLVQTCLHPPGPSHPTYDPHQTPLATTSSTPSLGRHPCRSHQPHVAIVTCSADGRVARLRLWLWLWLCCWLGWRWWQRLAQRCWPLWRGWTGCSPPP